MSYAKQTILCAHLEDIEQHLSLGEFSILQLPPVWCNDLHARWDCLGEDCDCPRHGIQKSYALSERGIWEDNDYGLPPQVMSRVHIYSFFTTDASFNLAEYKEKQHSISPFRPRWSRKKVALPWRGLSVLNISWDNPTNTRGRLWWWEVSPNCWPGVVWGASAK